MNRSIAKEVRHSECSAGTSLKLFALALALALVIPAAAQQTAPNQPADAAVNGGPVRLRQPTQATAQPERTAPNALAAAAASAAAIKPSEFEAYVQDLASRQSTDITRFGSELLTNGKPGQGAPDYSPIVPADYVVQAGDELVVTLWGSVDADLRLQVDRSGRISIPRVGPVMVSGVRYADLSDVISRRVALVFKNFQLSVSLGQLRGLRVYVTGFVQQPGVHVVSSLSTMVQALMRAGGPSAAGSFRNVQLRRGREVVANVDLYDLLLSGDRGADRLVQAEDVIFVGAVGQQVALIGSVNRPAVFELKPGETAADLLRMAGGFAAVADTTRLAVERLDERATVRVTQLDAAAFKQSALHTGDVVRAFNAMGVQTPGQKQNKRVRIEGEVARPGEYIMPPNSSLLDALNRAGGLTSAAYLFGTEFMRESVRATQQQNFDRAVSDLETDMIRASATSRVATAEDVAAQSNNVTGTSRLIERLRAIKPTGRIVLQLPAEGGQLPELALEDGDRLYVPPRPNTVGVFGSVFTTGSFLHTPGRGLEDYLRLAGGPKRGADDKSIFVVRANGSVISNFESEGWLFNRRVTLNNVKAEPGDTIFVPEELNKSTLMQTTRDWTQIFFQLAVGLAGVKTVTGF